MRRYGFEEVAQRHGPDVAVAGADGRLVDDLLQVGADHADRQRRQHREDPRINLPCWAEKDGQAQVQHVNLEDGRPTSEVGLLQHDDAVPEAAGTHERLA